MARCFMLGLLLAACAGPSAEQKRETEMVTRRLMDAAAVHLPPGGRASCVGRAVRLTEPGAEGEREASAQGLDDETARAVLTAAGWGGCAERYEEARALEGLMPEVLTLDLGYGVDPEGAVCAVVEQRRAQPIDPRAAPLLESAAVCAKDVLFAARFPAGLVEGEARVVRLASLRLGEGSR